MVIPGRYPIVFAALAAFPAFAHGTTLAEMTKSCQAEIQRVEATIAKARTKVEYQSEQGRLTLSNADRWLHQARKHAVKGESRNCMSAVGKSRALI